MLSFFAVNCICSVLQKASQDQQMLLGVIVSVSVCYQDGLWVVLLPLLEIFLLALEFLPCCAKYISFLTRVFSHFPSLSDCLLHPE